MSYILLTDEEARKRSGYSDKRNISLSPSQIRRIVDRIKQDSSNIVQKLKESETEKLLQGFDLLTFGTSIGYYLKVVNYPFFRIDLVDALTEELIERGEWQRESYIEDAYIYFATEDDITSYINQYIKVQKYYLERIIDEKDQNYISNTFNLLASTADMLRIFAASSRQEQEEKLREFVVDRKQISEKDEWHLEYIKNGIWSYALNSLSTTEYDDGYFNFEGTYCIDGDTTKQSKVETPYKFNSSFSLPSLVNGNHLFDSCNVNIDNVIETPSLVSGVSMYANCKQVHIPSGADFKYLLNGKDMFKGCSLTEQDLINLANSLGNVKLMEEGKTVNCIAGNLTVLNDLYLNGDQNYPHALPIIRQANVCKTISVSLVQGYTPSQQTYRLFENKGWTLEVLS